MGCCQSTLFRPSQATAHNRPHPDAYAVRSRDASRQTVAPMGPASGAKGLAGAATKVATFSALLGISPWRERSA